MTHLQALLSGEPDEVAQLLVQLARRERAPEHARQRALSGLAAVSVGAALATGTKASWAASMVAGSGAVLAGKWLVVGLGAALVGLTAVDRIGRLMGQAAVHRPAPPAAVRALGSGRVAPREQRLPPPPAPAVTTSLPAAATAKPLAIVSTPPAVNAAAAVATPSSNVTADVLASPAAQLTREVAALRRARAALADGSPALALAVLTTFHQDLPVSVLGTEEAALRVEIAFALGEPRAPELARRFLLDHPKSPLAQRIRALLDARGSLGKKP